MPTRTTLIGFAGDSGAGKSTYVKGLASLLGTERVTIIGLDDYHTLDRAQRKAVGITPLNPRCNDLGLVADHALQMKRGETIVKPVYNHSTGTFDPDEEITPGEFVILEGLHPLYLESIRLSLDLKIYFDTDPALKLHWKIKRDVQERGHTLEQVKAEIAQRQPDILAYIEPQKRFADLIVTLAPGDETNETIKVLLAEKPALTSIASRLSQDGWRKRLGLRPGTPTLPGFDVLEVVDPVPAETVAALLAALGATEIPQRRDTYDAVALSQVLVAWRILASRQQAEVIDSYVAQG